jgi:regulator of protease activity HflC (stomatin/prohibitin superfamily)
MSILGAGREAAARELAERMQTAADTAGLGIEIVLVNLQGVHPPPDVAKDYQDVIASVQERQAAILNAEAERNRIQTELAGSIRQADRLLELGRQEQAEAGSGDAGAEVSRAFQEALADARGEAYETLRAAEAYRFERARLAEATGQRFQNQLKAYRASKDIYRHLQRLLVLEGGLKTARKYVVVANEDDQQIFIIDLEESLGGGILDFDLLKQEGK